MEAIYKNKLWSAVLLVLVIANVATLGIFWHYKMKEKPTTTEQGPANTANFVIAQTGFSMEQQLAYRKLIEEHQERVRSAQNDLRETKDQLFDMLSDTTVSQQKIDSLTGIIGKTEQALDAETFRHFKQVRALCTPVQKIKFDNIIKQVMRMMGPQAGRPQGPPPPDRAGADGMPPPPPADGQGQAGPPPR